MQPLPSHTPRLIRCLAFVLAGWLAFAFSFTPLRNSHDEWWHLKTGQYIAQHGLPKNEIFTYTAADIGWDNHEWLTQLAMYRIYEFGERTGLGGIRAVITFKALFIILTFFGLGLVLARDLSRRGFDSFWAALAAALCVALARRTFYPRPPFVSYLLIAIMLWIFIETGAQRWRRAWLWLLPPLFALWTNLHGAWLAGLVIFGAFWADAAFTWLIALKFGGDAQSAARPLRHLTLVGAACALATLANPYGIGLYKLAGRVFSDAYLMQSIGEMMPPNQYFVWVMQGAILLFAAAALRPHRPMQWLVTAFVLILLAAGLAYLPPVAQAALAIPCAVLAIARAQPPAMFAHILIVSFFLQQGIMHVRHLSLLGVVALPSLAWALAGWAASLAATQETQYGVVEDDGTVRYFNPAAARPLPNLQPLAWMLGSVAFIVLSIWWLFNTREVDSYWMRNEQLASGQQLAIDVVHFNAARRPIPTEIPSGLFYSENYPTRAVDFLLRANLPAPLFNGGNYAGYLIWRLSPEHMKVFTDNRYDIYGGLVIRDEHSVLNGWTHATISELKRRGTPLGAWDRAWNEVLDKWNVQTIFIPADAGGNIQLMRGGWARVYEDLGFNIWVRDTPANTAVIARARNLPLPPIGLIAQAYR